MIKKHVFEVDGTEIELTPEQAKQLRDELLQIYPVDSAPVQPTPGKESLRLERYSG